MEIAVLTNLFLCLFGGKLQLVEKRNNMETIVWQQTAQQCNRRLLYLKEDTLFKMVNMSNIFLSLCMSSWQGWKQYLLIILTFNF